MDLLEALILGIVQGATEFLPVSSSGHLVLVSWWLDIDTPPLFFSVIVHLGTTVAILIYFWRDWLKLIEAAMRAVRTRHIDLQADPQLRLFLLLIVGSIPAGIAGLLLADYFETAFSKPAIVSVSLLITAGLLTYSEWISTSSSSPNTQTPTTLRFADAFFIGCAQALAIMPGISRSGSTISGGLFRGLSRVDATRYSFLLATPIIIAAGFKQFLDVIFGDVAVGHDQGMVLIVGFISAALVGYASIALLLQLVRRQGLYGFAIYCVAFGLLSLGAIWLRG